MLERTAFLGRYGLVNGFVTDAPGLQGRHNSMHRMRPTAERSLGMIPHVRKAFTGASNSFGRGTDKNTIANGPQRFVEFRHVTEACLHVDQLAKRAVC